MFELHPQLQADCHLIGDLPLCRALLMDDSLYPWVILVPRTPGVTELYQLSEEQRSQLAEESARVAKTMAASFGADKMNVAALGNVVPQLHIHHIARFRTDSAWPAPVWGAAQRQPYAPQAASARVETLRAALGLQ